MSAVRVALQLFVLEVLFQGQEPSMNERIPFLFAERIAALGSRQEPLLGCRVIPWWLSDPARAAAHRQ